jgi:SRSO17 transposase
MAEMRRHVVAEMGSPSGVLVIDGSAFPKKGTASCGVARQWCGRLGKTDNCQQGVFLAYVVGEQYAPLDRRLYLPEEWARDAKRRKQCHVPRSVRFQEKWRIAQGLIERCRDVPHAWITGDDEFGRVTTLRARLRRWKERYVLDVPCNTLVRDLSETPPPKRSPRGRHFRPPFRRVDAWAALQPDSHWQTFTVRDGEKGPLKVRAISRQVRAKGERSRIGPEERLVVFRTLETPSRTCYCLSNADPQTPLADILQARSARPRVEQMFEEGNGDVGLDHYEVRSWVGWHHHMTLSLLALWFLALERRHSKKKRPRSRSVKPDTS